MQSGEWERLESELKKLTPVLDGTALEIEGDLNRPPMPFNEVMKITFEKAAAIAAKIRMELKAGGTGGASDGNFVAPFGIPVLDGMGAVGEGGHSDREYIFADSLEQKARLIASLLHDW
jgi:glutamate carboxypeptidase